MMRRKGFLWFILTFLSAGPVLAGYMGTRTILTDGLITDWTNGRGLGSLSDNSAGVWSNQYIWKDAYSDDTGDGDYAYPTNSANFNAHSADIDQFRVCWSTNRIYFMLRNHNATAFYERSAFFIGIDTGTPNSGMRIFAPSSNGAVFSNGPSVELRCNYPRIDYLLFASRTYQAQLWNSSGKPVGDGNDIDNLDGIRNNIYVKAIKWNEYEIAVPRALLGNQTPADSTWRFIVGTGFDENQMFREVQGYPLVTEWFFTGGDNTWWNNASVDPDVCDLIGTGLSQQQSDLAGYTAAASPGDTNSFTTITSSFVTVADYNKFLLQPSSVQTAGGSIVPLTIRGYNTVSTGSFLNSGYTATVYSNIGRITGTNFYATNITKATARGFIAFTMPGVSAYTLRVTLTSNTVTTPATNVEPEVLPSVPFSVEVSPSYLTPADEKLTVTVGVSDQARVECFIYSLNGTLVRKIEKQLTRLNNSFDWDRKGDSGKKAGSGLYLIKIKMGSNVATKKVLLAN